MDVPCLPARRAGAGLACSRAGPESEGRADEDARKGRADEDARKGRADAKTPVKAVRAKTPVKVVRAKTPLQTMRATTSFSFPGRAEDLTSGEYWYRGKKIHGSGVQKLGYDLGAVRYDRKEKAWSQYKPGVAPGTDRDDTKNSD